MSVAEQEPLSFSQALSVVGQHAPDSVDELEKACAHDPAFLVEYIGDALNKHPTDEGMAKAIQLLLVDRGCVGGKMAPAEPKPTQAILKKCEECYGRHSMVRDKDGMIDACRDLVGVFNSLGLAKQEGGPSQEDFTQVCDRAWEEEHMPEEDFFLSSTQMQAWFERCFADHYRL
eukprot:TRINITY_DN1170_c0_g1_i1.p1 TRINITY_DN1170_c0_g1~~TRINITY_DN1170_c0_g1_i1.p1  ORF type:complete len:174 (+),score=41.61 TRINITY_DN1170_c0_g1_i1:162-683(+)